MNTLTTPLIRSLIDTLPYGDRQLAIAKLNEADPAFLLLLEQAMRLTQGFNGLGGK
jgi:hypothetical protein